MDKRVINIINDVVSLSQKSLEAISELLEIETIDKGNTIASVGQFNTLEYFLLDGVCKSYLFGPDGDEVTLSFYIAPCIISPFTTRTMAGKSLLNLKALTNTTLACLDAKRFEHLMVEDVDIRLFGNTVLQQELMIKVKKEIGLASLSGREKLEALRVDFPNLENLVPHSDIASYLGITPISLSRLRGNK